MKKKNMTYISDPLVDELKKIFTFVNDSCDRKYLAEYLLNKIKEDEHLIWLLDHFEYSEPSERSFWTKESIMFFDEDGNIIDQKVLREYLCLPTSVKIDHKFVEEN